MSIEKAKDHYTGKNGCQRLNCAHSVAQAFKGKFSLSDEDVARFSGLGGGRAPLGECGALYAARTMLEKAYPARIKECEDILLAHAGSLKCREIRSANKLSCVGCVEKMAQCLEKI